ncbi:hypothetical protein [Nocardia caishijiensis]|uniref:Uncharacterized protein n=1 Tax=Nocardia caishijiensis TaxID=184756 RepID=A0ABQ6YR59_9NOCA|nr:hypothetical protein [Nocardia caishijiensis]KAF0848278.1 hypothetical protein FNL39_102426 [Nocardia caishijiensis]
MGISDDVGRLKNDAAANVFKFDPVVSGKLATMCASLLYGIEKIETSADSVRQMHWFSNQPSGEALAAKFSRAGRDLLDRLKEHKAIVNDLGEAFVSAGKLIQSNEQGSTAAFARIRTGLDSRLKDEIKFAGGGVSPANVTVSSNVKDGYRAPGDGLKAVAAKQDGKYTDPVAPEAGVSFLWDDFYYNHLLMEGNAQMIRDRTFVWGGAERLFSSEIGKFENGMTTLLSNDSELWKGEAPTRALNAINAYIGDAKAMANSMRLINENLANACTWIANLQMRTPREPSAGKQESVITKNTKLYQSAWDEIYVKSVRDSSDSIPFLRQAASPVNAQPPQLPVVNPNGSGAGTNGTGAGGGGDTSQAAAAQKALEDQQKAIEEAQRKAEEDAAKEAAAQAAEDAQEALQEAAEQALDTAQQAVESLQSSAEEASTGLDSLEAAAEDSSAAAQDALSQGPDALSQGLQAAQEALEQGLQSSEETLQQSAMPLAGIPGLSSTEMAAKAGGAGGGGGAKGAASGLPMVARDGNQSRLFPRSAVVAADVGSAVSRAGIAGVGTPGTPGAMGPGAAGAGQGQSKEHKRPEYLRSSENLDEVLGEAPVVVRPVVER